ncbi:MAG: ABC transporter ATP-binding protein [Gemmatimonadaceae bacterium]
MYRRLLRFLRPHAWRMAGTIACNIGAAALDAFSFALLIPFLNTLFDQPPLPVQSGWVNELLRGTIGSLVDPTDKMGSLRNVILIMLATVTTKNLLVWFSGQLGATLQEFVTRDMRDAVYRHLQRLPLGYFARNKTGQILTRVLTDTAQTKAIITEVVTRSLQSGALVIAYVAFLIGISVQLTFWALVVAPLLLVALQPLLRKLRKGYRRLSNQTGEMASIVQESVSGVRLVKSFGAERYEEGRFLDASQRVTRGMVKVTRVAFLAQPITEIIGTSVAVLILWIGARLVLVDHTMAGSDLIAFLLYVMRLLQPLKQLSQIPTTAQQSLASAERVFEILDAPTEVQLDRGTIAPARFERALAFDDVSFAYAGAESVAEPVLSRVSLTARKGEVVALVGPSGAGKSTLVDLIPRFYEPTAGRILLDGVDTGEIRLDALRALTGIVSQDTVLFNDTVRANIAYGQPGRYTDAQVEAAARAANAHGFIRELPEGYDTVLGERGTRLSGGQRQRIAIARALLTDPPILILDEATSALDTESERLVQEAIDRLLAGRTVFVIAHRLSTVEHADQILVLDRGRIVERGTHAELLALRGAYWRLHSLQFREAGSGKREEVPA